MEIVPLRLSGLLLVKPRCFADARGYFFETWRQSAYERAGISTPFVQDNAAFSKQGVVRGLHYQETPGQAKLVTALSGRIWDVAVDIRKDSPMYGKWEAVELSEENHWQLFIPVGFAHGYCTLSDAQVSYKVSAPYDPAEERTIRWDDPTIAIPWPFKSPIVSERDKEGALL